MDLQEIPEAIKPYIIEIANKMSDGRAALMVGSGFSRNATKSDANMKDLPTWNDLGDIFYEKIHGVRPGPEVRYLNILKLAEEVDATFGRAILNEILIDNIPDKDFSPSELYTKLLTLNWTDVFTTNYDTLLERACENVFSRRYDIIVNQHDLVYSKQPRIIKLHGSFPSERPLIVSESDYRRYPKQFAPFINTVQQALLENTLCLIGFSADDPNFLQWIGWIHDNLGKENSPKIYMIGLFTFSEAQKRHLDRKNVILVNLNEFADNDHQTALNLFFDHLLKYQSKDNSNWPKGYLRIQEKSENKFKDLVSTWEHARNAYPNWVILPEEQRELLWNFTKGSVSTIEDVLGAGQVIDIQYCYELNWRMEKCLYPLIDDVEPIFSKVFDKYAFFGLEIEGVLRESDLQLSSYEKEILIQKWSYLGVALLRSYREQGKLFVWKEHFERLSKISGKFSQELLAKLSYEKALFSLFSHDYNELWKDLEMWPNNESLPFWEARRAGLLVEVGQSKEAIRILERTLSYVRKHLNLTLDASDYQWKSQEAYIMYLLFCVCYNLEEYQIDVDQHYWSRWTQLATEKCDPWLEKRLFDQGLKSEFIPWTGQTTKSAFHIGFKDQEISNKEDVEALRAYAFTRFLEEIGFPLSLRNYNVDGKVMAGALNRIINYSPYLSISTMSRFNDSNVIKKVLSREQIAKLDIENINILIEHNLKVYFEVFPKPELRKAAELFIFRMPELLSRFCVKCSADSKLKIYNFIYEIYINKLRTREMKSLFSLISGATANEVKCQLIPQFLRIPLEIIDDHEFPDPIYYLTNFELNQGFGQLEIPEWEIVRLLAQSACGHGNRAKATYRLFTLSELGVLDPVQQKRLQVTVWTCVDDNGYPIDITYDPRFVLKSAPGKEFDVITVLKNQLIRRNFVNDTPGSLSIHGSKNRLVLEFIRLSKTLDNFDGIEWSLDELAVILEKLIGWWNADKGFIEKFINESNEADFFSGRVELKNRFKSIIDLIVKIVPVEERVFEQIDLLEKLKHLVSEMEESGVSVLRAKACFVHNFYDNPQILFHEIEQAMKESDLYIIVDAFDALLFLVSYHGKEKGLFVIDQTLELLAEPLRWNIVPHKQYSASILTEIVRFMPEIKIDSVAEILLEYFERGIKSYERNGKGDDLIYLKKDVGLASAMYRRFHLSGNEIPDILEQWKNLALDDHQFSDISISWK